MNDEQLLTVIRFLLIKIQDVAVQCSAMQVVLHVNGISSPEDLDAKVQQLADSEGFRNERSEILNLGPLDEAIARIAQRLEALDK